MKLIIFSLVTLFSAQAFSIPNTCFKNAAEAVRYDGEEAYATECSLASNKSAVICEVVTDKGGGAASDTWRVVLSKNCSTVYRTEMLFEE